MAGSAGRRNILREISSFGDRDGGVNFQNAALPPTPTSPDETVIQQRGHQRKSATYNFGASDPVFFKTPTKSPKKTFHQRLNTPTKSPVRSSPRKRVATSDKLKLNEKGIADMTISIKRLKKGPFKNVKSSQQFEKGLKALSHEQLVKLVSAAAESSPKVKQVIDDLIPVPDLVPLEERLYSFQKNIFKSFPRNVWGTQDSSYCYKRVRTHLEAYKKECLDICRQLMESHHWPAIFEYILIAWSFSINLPDWDNFDHNKIKSTCMRQLAAQCITAMKEADLDKPALTEIIERMQSFSDHSSVNDCIKYASDLLEKTA